MSIDYSMTCVFSMSVRPKPNNQRQIRDKPFHNSATWEQQLTKHQKYTYILKRNTYAPSEDLGSSLVVILCAPFFVPNPSFLWSLRRAVLRGCGTSWISALILWLRLFFCKVLSVLRPTNIHNMTFLDCVDAPSDLSFGRAHSIT